MSVMKPLMQPLIDRRDPHWDKVVALLHFDGDLIDEARGSWNTYLAGFIDDSRSKFGSGSLSTSARGGASGGVEQVDTGDDFTLEGWVYLTNLTPLSFIYSSRHGAVNIRATSLYVENGILAFQIYSNSSALQLFFGAELSTNEWTHVAVTYEKTTNLLRMFQHGIKTCEEVVSEGWTAQHPRYLAAWPDSSQPSRYLRGNLDEWRETKGVARYTKNFTPPSKPFPNK